MAVVAKDTPLNEITLRRYEKPYQLEGRDLIKKLCLSIGLLQPGDSRDVIVDILRVLLDARDNKKFLDSKEIENQVVQLRRQENLPLLGIAPSNIRRQLKRLKDIFIVESINKKYRISEFDKLTILFDKKIEKFYLQSILERIREYLHALEG